MKPVTNGRRPRGRPNRKQHGSGGPQRQNAYDGGGSDGRARGNAHQVYERYLAMARDALSAGDRVAAEAYYQHAEHYFRVLNSSTDPQPNGQGRPNRQTGDGRHDDHQRDNGQRDDAQRDGQHDGQHDGQRAVGGGGQQPSAAAISPNPISPAPILPAPEAVAQTLAVPMGAAATPDDAPNGQEPRARAPQPGHPASRRRGPAQPRAVESAGPSGQPTPADNPDPQPARRPRGCEPASE